MPIKKCETVDTLLWGTAKFGRGRDRCNSIEDSTIPYTKCSQSIREIWFVSSPTLVPIKKCETVDTLLWGTAKFGRGRDRCNSIEDSTIPYTKCSQSIRESWFVSSPTLVPIKNAKL